MTQTTNTTGGPAFPASATNDTNEWKEGFNHDSIPPNSTAKYRGMTLRDYFAAKAMQGMAWTPANMAACASECYRVADAMLQARGE